MMFLLASIALMHSDTFFTNFKRLKIRGGRIGYVEFAIAHILFRMIAIEISYQQKKRILKIG